MNRLVKKDNKQLREGIEKVCAKRTEAANVPKNFNSSQQGRPDIEVGQPELLSIIMKTVQNLTAADNHRRTDCLRKFSILDYLHTELTKIGYNFNQSGLYLSSTKPQEHF